MMKDAIKRVKTKYRLLALNESSRIIPPMRTKNKKLVTEKK